MEPSPTSNTSQVISWHDVEAAADTIFCLYSDRRHELSWARVAWETLVSAGLARYSSSVERHQVLFRLLALGGIYNDFCLASDVGFEYEYLYWTDELEIDHFVVGRIYERLHDPADEDDDIAFEDTLTELVEHERWTVVKALEEACGSANALYLFLCASIPEPESEDEDRPEVSDAVYSSIETLIEFAELYAPITPMRAYAWVAEGCSRYGP
jgi:hypothetical protein